MLYYIFQATEIADKGIQQTSSILDIFVKMGVFGMIVCAIIFLLSIVGVFIFVERLIALNHASKTSSNFMDKIKESIMGGNMNAAMDLCNRTQTPVAKVIEKGITRIGQPTRDIQMAMDAAINVAVFDLEKRLNVLSMIAKLAPMFGFIGTIAGVIKIFYDISTTGDYNIEVISGGLYNKMITSLLGLGLGIIAFTLYFIINSKIDSIIHKMEKSSLEFLDILSTPSK